MQQNTKTKPIVEYMYDGYYNNYIILMKYTHI